MHDPEEGGPFIAGKITVLERQSFRKRKWEWQSVKYSGFSCHLHFTEGTRNSSNAVLRASKCV